MVIVVAAAAVAAVAAGIYRMRLFVLCGSIVDTATVPGIVFRMHVRSSIAREIGY